MADTAPTTDVSSPSAPQEADTVDWFNADSINAFGTGALHQRMGIVITEASKDRVVGTMPVEGNTQPYGLLHGGASVVLAEGLGSILAVITAGPGRAAVGVDINATHHRPAMSGIVTGVATPISVGRTMGSYEIVMTDDQGRRLCTCRLTCSLRDLPPAPRDA
ncbi:MAG: hotdog fold thioesterase [Dermatophilaceae bacterium]|jgi:1,4-dihydroxy-2-naphthoyl-CoA hydrolase|nr:hotdog fold thioesterase [Actinomycetales bacterium]MBP8880856.1 hotdog fold thioesterase [Dermatophilaceae bacterium]MBP9919079.1 hotdog fold thioesterase [Dermatophilaceae bacterium]